VITYYGEEFSEMDETKLSKSISWSGPQRRCNELQTTCAAWKHVYIRFQREIERERERESSLDGVAGQKNVQLNADASRTVHMCGVGAAVRTSAQNLETLWLWNSEGQSMASVGHKWRAGFLHCRQP
jgi:hypothetical protein